MILFSLEFSNHGRLTRHPCSVRESVVRLEKVLERGLFTTCTTAYLRSHSLLRAASSVVVFPGGVRDLVRGVDQR